MLRKHHIETHKLCVSFFLFLGGWGSDGAAGCIKGESGDRGVHGPLTEGTERDLKLTQLIIESRSEDAKVLNPEVTAQ